jgi:hypothetical protein
MSADVSICLLTNSSHLGFDLPLLLSESMRATGIGYGHCTLAPLFISSAFSNVLIIQNKSRKRLDINAMQEPPQNYKKACLINFLIGYQFNNFNMTVLKAIYNAGTHHKKNNGQNGHY